MSTEKRFFHSGDLGDIIYSLPTIRALGGGHLVLALSQARFDVIAPLLRIQPYMKSVTRDPRGIVQDLKNVPDGITHDLNIFRRPEYGPLSFQTLVVAHARPWGVKVSTEPWLDVPTHRCVGRFICVARSERYHNAAADWDTELDGLGAAFDEVLFLGTKREHAVFGRRTKFFQTNNAYEIGMMIWSGGYFSGNQSFPLSIAIGLGVDHSIEVYPQCPNCSFPEMKNQRLVAGC